MLCNTDRPNTATLSLKHICIERQRDRETERQRDKETDREREGWGLHVQYVEDGIRSRVAL